MTVRAIINGKVVSESELHHYYICSDVVSKIIHDINSRIAAQNEHDFDESSNEE